MTIGESIRQFISRATVLRLGLSLIMAILLWGWVNNLVDPEIEREFSNVAVDVPTLPDGMVLVTQPSAISVTVYGPESSVAPLNTGHLDVQLDLSGVTTPGTYDVPYQVEVDGRYRGWRANPSRLNVVIEPSSTRVEPIQFDISDVEGANRRVGELQPDVTEVTISGAETVVQSVDRVIVPIDIGTRTSEFSETYTPYAVTANNVRISDAELSITPATLSVTVPIVTSGKEVPVLTFVEGDPATGHQYYDRTINPRTVIIDGPPDILESINYVETVPVNIDGATGTVIREVRLLPLPDSVTLVSPSSNQITVVAQIRQRGVSQTFPTLPVTVIGVEPGLEATLDSNGVSLEVLASEGRIADLAAGGMSVIVDLTGLPAGTYALEPSVIVPAGVEWSALSPSRIEVTLAPADESANSTPQAELVGTPPVVLDPTEATSDSN